MNGSDVVSFMMSIGVLGSSGNYQISSKSNTYVPFTNSHLTGDFCDSNQRRAKVFQNLVRTFQEGLNNYPYLVDGFSLSAKEMFKRSIDNLANINDIDNIIFSFTNSKSLYFRLYKGNQRAHIEVFFDDADEENFIATLYSFDRLELNVVSDIDTGFGIINKNMSPFSVYNSFSDSGIFSKLK